MNKYRVMYNTPQLEMEIVEAEQFDHFRDGEVSFYIRNDEGGYVRVALFRNIVAVVDVTAQLASIESE